MKKNRLPTQKIRRSFVLIEVLVAFALVALCLFPLLRPQLAILRHEVSQMERIQLERVASHAFAAVKQDLHENHLAPFKILEKGFSGVLEEPFILYFPKKRTAKYICNYQIEKKKSYQRQSDSTRFVLLNVSLSFCRIDKPNAKDASSFSYSILVARQEDA